LKDFGRLPTYRVAAIVGMSVANAKEKLEQMAQQKKIIKEKETTADYWRAK
jgi:hypothetical protein